MCIKAFIEFSSLDGRIVEVITIKITNKLNKNN